MLIINYNNNKSNNKIIIIKMKNPLFQVSVQTKVIGVNVLLMGFKKKNKKNNYNINLMKKSIKKF